MLKKNLIGIFIVCMMLGVFIGGYNLGKQSNIKVNKPGMANHVGSGKPSAQHGPSRQTTKEDSKKGDFSKKDQVSKKQAPLGQVFYGTVIPYEQANVQGEQGAAIVMLKFKEGDVVRKGDILIKLNDETKKLDLLEAQSVRKLSLQQVKQSEFNYNTEIKKLERNKGLFKDKLISQQEFDNINNTLQSAASSFEIAKENLIQAETKIKIIKNTLKNYIIKAPISGIIDKKYYNLGEVYRSGDIIYHLINVDQIYAEIKVPETYLNEIKIGMDVLVIFNALEDKTFPGIVETVLSTDASDSRNFTTKIRIKNPNQIIKPGMFARIETGDKSMVVEEAGK